MVARWVNTESSRGGCAQAVKRLSADNRESSAEWEVLGSLSHCYLHDLTTYIALHWRVLNMFNV